jgi:type I restriction-modification system DNA methylase subunit
MANNGLEQTLWAAADKLRGHLDAAEYKHVVLAVCRKSRLLQIKTKLK